MNEPLGPESIRPEKPEDTSSSSITSRAEPVELFPNPDTRQTGIDLDQFRLRASRQRFLCKVAGFGALMLGVPVFVACLFFFLAKYGPDSTLGSVAWGAVPVIGLPLIVASLGAGLGVLVASLVWLGRSRFALCRSWTMASGADPSDLVPPWWVLALAGSGIIGFLLIGVVLLAVAADAGRPGFSWANEIEILFRPMPYFAIVGAIFGTLVWLWVRLLRWQHLRTLKTSQTNALDDSVASTVEILHQCAVCGLTSPDKEHFVDVPRPFGKQVDPYCPVCLEKWYHARLRRGLLLFGITLTVGLALSLGPLPPLGTIIWKVCLLIAVFHALTVPRELFQALVARLLGLRVFAIEFGAGPELWRCTMAGTTWLLHAYPTAASSMSAGHPNLRLARLKRCLIILSGFAMDLGLAVLAAWWFWPAEWTFLAHPIQLRINETVILAAVFRCFGDVGPYWRSLVDACTEPDAVRTWQVSYFLQEANAAHERKDYAAGAQWCEMGLQALPDHPILMAGLSASLLFTPDYSRAREIDLRICDHPDLEPSRRPHILGGIAMANLMLMGTGTTDDRELLEEAERCLQEMIRRIPWTHLTRLIHGCLRIEQGRLDEGTQILRSLQEEQPSATVSAYLAFAAAKGGHPEEYRQHLTKARELKLDAVDAGIFEKKTAKYLGEGAALP